MAAVRRRDRSTNRYVALKVPLFSNYLFIAHVPGSPWRGIRGAPGVGKLLLDGFRPQYAGVGAIEMLQATEEARRNPVPEAAWRSGAACTIDRGTFSGQDGVVVEVHGSSARIGLFVFGQLRDVSVPIENLAPRETATCHRD